MPRCHPIASLSVIFAATLLTACSPNLPVSLAAPPTLSPSAPTKATLRVTETSPVATPTARQLTPAQQPRILAPTIPPPRGATIADIIDGDRSCELPCWWGIRPGVSGIADVPQALINAGANPPGLPPGEYESRSFTLRGTDPPVTAWAGLDLSDDDLVIDLQLWINEGTANSGLTEVAALQDLLGPPESILYSRYLGQSIYFAYPTRGLLVAFLLPLGDTPEVCLAEEIGPFTIVDFHDPATRPGLTRQRTEIPPINWPSAINLTVDALWEALQDGSSCVPGAY